MYEVDPKYRSRQVNIHDRCPACGAAIVDAPFAYVDARDLEFQMGDDGTKNERGELTAGVLVLPFCCPRCRSKWNEKYLFIAMDDFEPGPDVEWLKPVDEAEAAAVRAEESRVDDRREEMRH